MSLEQRDDDFFRSEFLEVPARAGALHLSHAPMEAQHVDERAEHVFFALALATRFPAEIQQYSLHCACNRQVVLERKAMHLQQQYVPCMALLLGFGFTLACRRL